MHIPRNDPNMIPIIKKVSYFFCLLFKVLPGTMAPLCLDLPVMMCSWVCLPSTIFVLSQVTDNFQAQHRGQSPRNITGPED